MDVYPCTRHPDPWMHRTWSLSPRPRRHCSYGTLCELSYWPGQLGSSCGSGSSVPRPRRHLQCREIEELGQEPSLQLEADVSWKTFLKIKLDYYMGYDRN